MQMQVRDGLDHNIVDKDHRPVSFKPCFNRSFKPLRLHEEFLHSAVWQITHQENMDHRINRT